MSNLSNALQLNAIHSQLPVTAYFDEALLKREIDTLFKRGPRYIGHELMAPEAGSYFALPGEGEGRLLVRNRQDEIELLSNVCRHRQAIMLNGRGTAENIVCPLHRWTYDLDGQLLGTLLQLPGHDLSLHGWRTEPPAIFHQNRQLIHVVVFSP